MFDSDISSIQHYSTPISRSPTQDTPPTQQQKRPIKTSQNNVTTKRPKQNTENSNQNLRIKSPVKTELDVSHEDEETDYIEAPPSLKMDSMEQDESKQFLERNGNGSIVETNTQDQGRLLLLFSFCGT